MPVFNKKQKSIIKILLLTNIIIIITALLFFDYYKKRKINHYNKLYENKQKEIKEIESLFSKYYHSNEKFVFNKKDNKIIKTSKNEYNIKTFTTNLYFSKVTGKSTAYLDIYKDSLILASATGLFFKINLDNLQMKIFYL